MIFQILDVCVRHAFCKNGCFNIPSNDKRSSALGHKIFVNKSLHFLNSNSTGAVSFGTEAGVFNSVGIKTIVCGPGRIDEAHKPNEFISISQINKCKSFLEKIIQSLC